MGSLDGASGELVNGRRDNCASRAYFACFQAAVAALIRFGIYVADPRPVLGHDATQALFTRELIQRRKVFPAELRRTLPELIGMRHAADYWATGVSEREAGQGLARARTFVERRGRQTEGAALSTEYRIDKLEEAVRRHVEDIQKVILGAFPTADFVVYEGDDPKGVYLAVISDVADGFGVLELVSDRLADLLVDEGIAVHVVPVHRTAPDAQESHEPAYRRNSASASHTAAT